MNRECEEKAQRQAGDLCLGVWHALEFFDFGVYNFFVVYISTFSSHPVPIITSRCYWHLQRLCELFYASARWDYRWCLGRSLGRKPAMVFTIALMSLGTLMSASHRRMKRRAIGEPQRWCCAFDSGRCGRW